MAPTGPIATSDAESITIRGHDLCSDLIGKIDFTDYFWLLTLGEKPTELQRDVTNACLVGDRRARVLVAERPGGAQ